jgi:hypothetical protein
VVVQLTAEWSVAGAVGVIGALGEGVKRGGKGKAELGLKTPSRLKKC